MLSVVSRIKQKYSFYSDMFRIVTPPPPPSIFVSRIYKMHGRKQSMKENVQPSPSIWHLLEQKDSFDKKCHYNVFFMNIIQTRTATEIHTMTHGIL